MQFSNKWRYIIKGRTKKISSFINYVNDNKSRHVRQNSINKNPVKEKYKEYFIIIFDMSCL